jgi:hypothetical protein
MSQTVEGYILGKKAEVEKDFSCQDPKCKSKQVTLQLGWCSYYGEHVPVGHTCGIQKDNNYDDPKQCNPANIKDCDINDGELDLDVLTTIEAPNKLTILSLDKYDLFWRCAKCHSLTDAGDL